MTNGGGLTSYINQINKMRMVLPMIYMVIMKLSFYNTLNGFDCKMKHFEKDNKQSLMCPMNNLKNLNSLFICT
jgi:hypothetical protein